jgi:hypothetical protein
VGKKPHIFRQLFFPGAVLVIVRILRPKVADSSAHSARLWAGHF